MILRLTPIKTGTSLYSKQPYYNKISISSPEHDDKETGDPYPEALLDADALYQASDVTVYNLVTKGEPILVSVEVVQPDAV